MFLPTQLGLVHGDSRGIDSSAKAGDDTSNDELSDRIR